MRAPIDLAYLAMIYTGMIVGLCIAAIITKEKDFFSSFGKGVIMVMFILGIFTLFAPLKGFWDVVIDGDDVTVVKAFVF